jgi:uncharacterized membrane protein (UPF0127 family)
MVARLTEAEHHASAAAAEFEYAGRLRQVAFEEHAFGGPESHLDRGPGVMQGRLGLEPVGLRVAFHQAKQAKLASEAIAGTLARMFRLLFLALALGFVACDSPRPEVAPARELGLETRFPVRMGEVLAQVRVAISDLEKARGLMGVARLEEAEGMAFLYDEDGQLSFWMKDTLLDLDIAFVARDGTVLEVRTMTAGDTETTRSVTKQARFAVEMRAGWFRDFGVKPGDRVNLDDLRSAVKARGYDVKKFLP